MLSPPHKPVGIITNRSESLQTGRNHYSYKEAKNTSRKHMGETKEQNGIKSEHRKLHDSENSLPVKDFIAAL